MKYEGFLGPGAKVKVFHKTEEQSSDMETPSSEGIIMERSATHILLLDEKGEIREIPNQNILGLKLNWN